MASFRASAVKALLTTTLCVALTACGGEMPMQSGYNDDAMERTHNFSRAAARSALQERLDALEKTIIELRADYQRIASTYTGLVTTNERINLLLTQLEEERTQPASMPTPVIPAQSPPAVEQKPVPAPVAQKYVEKTSYSRPTIVGVRIGEHKDKTRLVIDSSSAINMTADLDNNEKILLVTFAGDWAAKKTVSGLSSPRIKGWSVQGGDTDKVLAIELKKEVVLAGTEKLKATKNSPAHFVIDLK